MKTNKNHSPVIGIAVAANNIESSTVRRFCEHAGNALHPGDLLEIATGETFGPYNKSREINRCIRSLLAAHCDIVVQCDIDILLTRDLIGNTRRTVVEGVHLWTPCIAKGEIRRSGKGSWNALMKSDWIMTGGFDERCVGWGFEDDAFHARCRALGLELIIGEDHPIHVDHPERPSWGHESHCASQRKNLEATREPSRINYLIDNLTDNHYAR